MKNLSKSWQLIAFCSIFLLAVSCDKDESNIPPANKENRDILIGASTINPDGHSGSNFIQLIKNIDKANYKNETALPVNFGSIPVLYKNWAFDISAFSNNGMLNKFERINKKELQKVGSLQLPSGALAIQIAFVNDKKAYISLWNQGKIIVFNPTTMKQTSIIDITKYGIGDENPDPSGMIIRGNKLYVALNQVIGHFPDVKRPYSDVLIIDINTDKPIKMITEKKSGFSYPSRPADPKTMFMDENGDIYIVCMSHFGTKGENLGILRIKNGETEFDTDYALTLNKASIEGETHTPNLFWLSQYGGNGKLYGLIHIYAYHSSTPNYVTDRTNLAVEIDLKTKAIKKLPDLPRGNSYGSIGLYNGKIVVGIASENSKGFHIYDPNTGKGTPEPVITVEGEPSCFRHFGEKY